MVRAQRSYFATKEDCEELRYAKASNQEFLELSNEVHDIAIKVQRMVSKESGSLRGSLESIQDNIHELRTSLVEVAKRSGNQERSTNILKERVEAVSTQAQLFMSVTNSVSDRLEELNSTAVKKEKGRGPTVVQVAVEESKPPVKNIEIQVPQPQLRTGPLLNDELTEEMEQRVQERIINYFKSRGVVQGKKANFEDVDSKLSSTVAATKERVDVLQKEFQIMRNEFTEFEGQVALRVMDIEKHAVDTRTRVEECEHSLTSKDKSPHRPVTASSGHALSSSSRSSSADGLLVIPQTEQHAKALNKPMQHSATHLVSMANLGESSTPENAQAIVEAIQRDKAQLAQAMQAGPPPAEWQADFKKKMEQLVQQKLEAHVQQDIPPSQLEIAKLESKLADKADLRHIVDVGYRINQLNDAIENLKQRKEDKAVFNSFYEKLTKLMEDFAALSRRVATVSTSPQQNGGGGGAGSALTAASAAELAQLRAAADVAQLRALIAEQSKANMDQLQQKNDDKLKQELGAQMTDVQAFIKTHVQDVMQDQYSNIAKAFSGTTTTLNSLKEDMQREVVKVHARIDETHDILDQKADKVGLDFIDGPPVTVFSASDLKDIDSVAKAIETLSSDVHTMSLKKADRMAVKLALESKGDAKVVAEKANRSYVEALFERLSQNVAAVHSMTSESKARALREGGFNNGDLDELKATLRAKVSRDELQPLMAAALHNFTAAALEGPAAAAFRGPVHCLTCDRPVEPSSLLPFFGPPPPGSHPPAASSTTPRNATIAAASLPERGGMPPLAKPATALLKKHTPRKRPPVDLNTAMKRYAKETALPGNVAGQAPSTL
eukprot:TRINITY_DN3960_c0_g1_i6.p1 TRINITY_DN3960_c0_g1~~TRINITY_DN3960_c0_g1_i6.p1  ORF type:complete len:950 (-),score=288.99 TRINITY_DN3960_c0_g1_i6:67-2577(-)